MTQKKKKKLSKSTYYIQIHMENILIWIEAFGGDNLKSITIANSLYLFGS